jgi:enoyl-CoA hydratase
MDKAMELAKSFAKNGPIAVKYAKAAINRGMQTDIDSGIAIENELWSLCFTTEDQKEGMAAFLEKRPADFKNK